VNNSNYGCYQNYSCAKKTLYNISFVLKLILLRQTVINEIIYSEIKVSFAVFL